MESFCEDQGIPHSVDEPLHPIDSPIECHTEAEPEAEGVPGAEGDETIEVSIEGDVEEPPNLRGQSTSPGPHWRNP